MKLFVTLLFPLLFFSFCREGNKNKEMDNYFEEEIFKRLKVLDSLLLVSNSLKVNTSEIDREVKNIILVSKDIENLNAAINHANQYFGNMAIKFGIKCQ